MNIPLLSCKMSSAWAIGFMNTQYSFRNVVCAGLNDWRFNVWSRKFMFSAGSKHFLLPCHSLVHWVPSGWIWGPELDGKFLINLICKLGGESLLAPSCLTLCKNCPRNLSKGPTLCQNRFCIHSCHLVKTVCSTPALRWQMVESSPEYKISEMLLRSRSSLSPANCSSTIGAPSRETSPNNLKAWQKLVPLSVTVRRPFVLNLVLSLSCLYRLSQDIESVPAFQLTAGNGKKMSDEIIIKCVCTLENVLSSPKSSSSFHPRSLQ